jgi:hypothetical protein
MRFSLALIGTPLLGAALLRGALLALPAHAADREFRQWWAACDNLRNCSAYGFAAETLADSYLRIAREGSGSAKPAISIALDADSGARFKLAFDDPALPGLPAQARAGETAGDSNRRRLILKGGDDEAFLGSLRKAKAIVITPIDASGKADEESASKISLTGAVAALLWIDEQQQRLGTVGALVQRGDKPDSSIPPSPKAPVITAAPGLQGAAAKAQPSRGELAVIEKKASSVCGDDGGKGTVEGATALSASSFLYEVRCPGLSGAYNSATITLIAPAGRAQAAQPAKFQEPETGGKKRRPGEEFQFNTTFSNTDMSMYTFAKGRGIGDCGAAERWVWDGKVFQLAERKIMTKCQGVPPDDWPAVHRAEIQ